MAKVSFHYRPPKGLLPGDAPEPEAASARGAKQDGMQPERYWHQSSWELGAGVLVSEQPLETLPGELLDEFFPPAR